MGPILLRPNYISPVWSGPRINEARGLEADVWYGESFDVSVHEGLVNMVEGGPFDGMSLDRLIDEHYRYEFGDESLTLDASTARGDEGQLLQYPTGSPLFILRKSMACADGRILHYSKSIIRADRVSYHFDVNRDGRIINRGKDFALTVDDAERQDRKS